MSPGIGCIFFFEHHTLERYPTEVMLKRCSVLALMHLVVAADSLANGTNGTAGATATQGLSAGCGALPRPACKHREVLECANTYLDCELIDSESEEEMAVQWTGDDGDQGAGATRRCQSLPACMDGYLSCIGACASEDDLKVRMRWESCS